MALSVHISYTVNIANDSNKYAWWTKQFVEEIKLAHKLSAFAVVVHLGRSLDQPEQVALNNMYINLIKINNKTKNIPIKILIETSTGQGSEMCYKLEDLARFYNKIKMNKEMSDRFGICLDTCHLFNAGYDIRTVEGVKNYMKQFDELIGIENIKLIHLNDSKNELGKKIDRHANIDKGHIGHNGLEEIVKLFGKLGVPLILETPDEFLENDILFIKKCTK